MKMIFIILMLVVINLQYSIASPDWINANYKSQVKAFFMEDNGTIIVGGGFWSKEQLSTDCGLNWQDIKFDFDCIVNNIFKLEGNLYLSVDCNSISDGIYRSSNNGEDWNIIREGNVSNFFLITEAGVMISIDKTSLDNEKLFCSTNNGYSWKEIRINVEIENYKKIIIFERTKKELIAVISFLDKNNQIYNQILSSNNGGLSWHLIIGTQFIGNDAIISSIDFDKNGNLFLVSTNSNKIACYNFSDQSLKYLTKNLISGISSIAVSRSGYIFISSISNEDGVFKSTDFGNTWSEMYDGLEHSLINKLIFHSQGGYIFAATDKGLFKTINPVSDIDENIHLESNNITLTHNLVSDDLCINLESKECRTAAITIYNSLGLVVYQNTYFNENSPLIVETHRFASGLYTCVYSNGSDFQVKKFVLAR